MNKKGVYLIKIINTNVPINRVDDTSDFYYHSHQSDGVVNMVEERERAELFNDYKLANFVANNLLAYEGRAQEYSIFVVKSDREEDYISTFHNYPSSAYGSELLDIFINEIILI